MESIELLRLFSYDPDTGNVATTSRKSGRPNRGVVIQGAPGVCLSKTKYLNRNLAWLACHGFLPRPYREFVKNINGDLFDNRLSNLELEVIRDFKLSPGEKITQERLKEMLHYDPEAGAFIRRVSTSSRALAGSNPVIITGDGYAKMSFGGRSCAAHRLAWIYIYGEDPAEDIDHINCNKADFRICNLRLVTPGQNALNMGPYKSSKTGFKGVFKIGLKRGDGSEIWVAESQVNGKKKRIGSYYSMDEAIDAYVEYAFANHGEFIHESLFPYLNTRQLEIVKSRQMQSVHYNSNLATRPMRMK